MRWKDLRIARKLYIGFGIVLALTLAVGFVGWDGVSEVSQAVENAADANQLVIWVKEAGAAQVAFLDTQDRKHYDAVVVTTNRMFDRLDETQARFSDRDDIALATDARNKTQAYRKIWDEWVDDTEDASAAMNEIMADANAAHEQFQALVGSQDRELAAAVAADVPHYQLAEMLRKSQASNQMYNLFLQSKIVYRNYKLSGDSTYAEKYITIFDKIIDLCMITSATIKNEQNVQQLDSIVAAAEGIGDSFMTFRSKYDKSARTAARLASVADDLVAALDEMRQHQVEKMDAAETYATAMTIGFLVGAILIGAFIAFVIARGISTPLARMAYVAEKISTGDIQHDINTRRGDEVGVLADAFRGMISYMRGLADAAARIAANDLTVDIETRSDFDVLGNSFKTMTANLIAMIRRLKENAGHLVSAANEISSASEQMFRGAQDQAGQVGRVSGAIEEMTATIVQSSRNAAEATDASKNASATAGEGGSIVADTIHGMQKIATVVRESSGSITRLAKSAAQIGEIIRVIDDIADQTNLLALNAAIEAARAGEQGRGFAVVADEVRKLAERTGKATGEIAEMIEGIQTDTDNAVQSMEAGIDEVNRGRDLADKAGDSLNDIVSMTQRVMDMIQQIATASEEQSTAAEEISQNVEHISSVTKETATGAEQSAAAAEQLNRQAEALQSMVTLFRLNYGDQPAEKPESVASK